MKNLLCMFSIFGLMLLVVSCSDDDASSDKKAEKPKLFNNQLKALEKAKTVQGTVDKTTKKRGDEIEKAAQ